MLGEVPCGGGGELVQLLLLGLAALACLAGLAATMLLLTRGQHGTHGGGTQDGRWRAPAGHAPTDPLARKRVAGHLWSRTAPAWFTRVESDQYPHRLHGQTDDGRGDARQATPVPRGFSVDPAGTRCAGMITSQAARTIRRAPRRRTQSSAPSVLPTRCESPPPPPAHEDANLDAEPLTAPSAEQDSQER
jgi:hypothetical protein